MKEILRVEHASFGYGSRIVVAGVDLVVRAGDFVGIAGPNGGGKTTLFRGMLGLIPAAAGRERRPGPMYGPDSHSRWPYPFSGARPRVGAQRPGSDASHSWR